VLHTAAYTRNVSSRQCAAPRRFYL
jgi:hypothetical protein